MKLQFPAGNFARLSLRLRRHRRRLHAAPLHRLEEGARRVGLYLRRRALLLLGRQASRRNHRRTQPDAGPQHARRSRRRAQGESLLSGCSRNSRRFPKSSSTSTPNRAASLLPSSPAAPANRSSSRSPRSACSTGSLSSSAPRTTRAPSPRPMHSSCRRAPRHRAQRLPRL